MSIINYKEPTMGSFNPNSVPETTRGRKHYTVLKIKLLEDKKWSYQGISTIKEMYPSPD
jgi:hypothetical protein